MTNHWIDIGNSDCILIMGSNAAENHPASFRWVTKAMERGAKVISVDPRFTRTSSRADIYAPLRSGTDIAFLGGMIKYILDHDLIHKDYVLNYTNASFLIDPGFDFHDGLFSGYNPEKGSYDKSTWKYQVDEKGIPLQDKTLQNPRCVYQLLKKHYSRYTLEKVSQITGTPIDLLKKVYETYGATGTPGKAGTILYAMGWTQHTVGTQNIRAMSIIQLLLGNMGIAGGGVNALRGESNVQGSTDQALLFHLLPGYLKAPLASDTTLEIYNKKYTPKTADPKSANWWGNYPKYSVSLLKALYGEAAQKENQFCYDYLPKLEDGKNYSWMALFDAMYKGKIKGFFAWGQNPACGGPHANKTNKALEKLDWLVTVNLWETETALFWKRPGVDPTKIKTEVFLLPCAASMEKEGSVTNSGRWAQWRYKAVDPPGEAKPDGDIINDLFLKVRELYEKEGGKFPEPIVRLSWKCGPTDEKGQVKHFDPHYVAKEINGYALADVIQDGKVVVKKGELMPSFAFLKDDGTTSSGNWIYCASYTEKGNMMARRDRKDPSGIGLYPGWAWSWPVNRRIIYNRASVDLEGKPWDEKRAVIRWDGSKWVGDVPDGAWPPGTKHPFIMLPEGYARLFALTLADGPFPEHYEPFESPVKNLMSSQQVNPAIYRWDKYGSDMDKYAPMGSKEYPIVATTYRVTEHWQTGAMTRWQPWLVELQPEMFVEMSEELAKEKGIKNGDWCTVISIRGKVKAKAIVTSRFKPFKINGKIVHEVGLPWCFGFSGLAKGDSANNLVPTIGDANTMIQESKAFLVDIRKGVN